MKKTFIPSPHFEERKAERVDMLILHYTATKDAQEAIDIMDARGVSAHYLVTETGEIIQLVDESERAYHAGESFWNGRTDINSHSIGIEIQNTGHEGGCPPYPEAQIKAVIELCRDILSRHPIPAKHVLGHSDVAPGRKIDPGEHFPWKRLAEAGIGRWPKGKIKDNLKPGDLDKLLLKIGYSPNCKPEERRHAFFMHFYPEGLKKEPSQKQVQTAVRRAKKLIDFS